MGKIGWTFLPIFFLAKSSTNFDLGRLPPIVVKREKKEEVVNQGAQ
jgi:hypothetical protein